MKFVTTIARRNGRPDTMLVLPTMGNEVIFGMIAHRLRHLQDVLKRDRLHTLIAVDQHVASTTIRGPNHYSFQLHESHIDVSASGRVSLLLLSKDGACLHWPRLGQADIESMAQHR